MIAAWLAVNFTNQVSKYPNHKMNCDGSIEVMSVGCSNALHAADRFKRVSSDFTDKRWYNLVYCLTSDKTLNWSLMP